MNGKTSLEYRVGTLSTQPGGLPPGSMQAWSTVSDRTCPMALVVCGPYVARAESDPSLVRYVHAVVTVVHLDITASSVGSDRLKSHAVAVKLSSQT